MKLHLAQLPRLIAERRSTAIFGVVIIAMLWSGICFKYVQDIRSDERDAERSNNNFAMVFEENVLRSIGEIDKSLLYLRRTIESRQNNTDFHTIVSTADLLSEIIVQVAIIDAKGIMRASNAGPQPAPVIDLSDREHYRVHLDSAEDHLFISKPVIGRASKQWSVQFTRRFLNSEGKFGGVVVTSLNPAHLTDFYNRIDFGSSTSIALIGLDGMVRSSGGGQRRLRTRARPRQHLDVSPRPDGRELDVRGRRSQDRRRQARHVPAGSRASADGQRQHGPQRNFPQLPRGFPAQLPGRPDPDR